VRHPGVGGLRLLRARRRGLGVGPGRGHAAAQLLHLGRERPAAGIELEQDRLGGLSGEPQLAPARVVAEALGRDGGLGGREQLVQRNDRQRRDALGRRADEDGEAAETGVAGASQQRERGGRIVGDDG
jgi:hypothetical protein